MNLMDLIEEWRPWLESVAELEDVTIKWSCGSLEIHTKHEDSNGGLSYSGVHHPDGLCEPTPHQPPAGREEGPFVCCWCGSTCW